MSEYAAIIGLALGIALGGAFGFVAGLLWPSVRYGDKPPSRNPPPWGHRVKLPAAFVGFGLGFFLALTLRAPAAPAQGACIPEPAEKAPERLMLAHPLGCDATLTTSVAGRVFTDGCYVRNAPQVWL